MLIILAMNKKKFNSYSVLGDAFERNNNEIVN